MSQIFLDFVMAVPIYSPMTSIDISAPNVNVPIPTISKTTPTRNNTNVPVSSGETVADKIVIMSAMGRMEVSDSTILSRKALLRIVLSPFLRYF